MNVLDRWNQLTVEEAAQQVLPCCGSKTWAQQLAEQRPIRDESSLIGASDEIWSRLAVEDWAEAFSHHPRIGERAAPPRAPDKSGAWSAQEQQKVAVAQDSMLAELAQANREYEQRFGRVFIVCATGKSAEEILEILGRRLRSDDDAELHESVEEQRKITNLRLKKWLSQ